MSVLMTMSDYISILWFCRGKSTLEIYYYYGN